MSFLVYDKYVYGGHTHSPLTEFKRRNGFEEVRVPRYFVPLTPLGRVGVTLRLHRSIRDRIPRALVSPVLGIRAWFYRRFERNGR